MQFLCRFNIRLPKDYHIGHTEMFHWIEWSKRGGGFSAVSTLCSRLRATLSLLPLSSLHGGNSFSLLASCVICSTAVYGISYEGKAQYEQWKYLLLFWIAIDFFLLFITTQLKVLSWIWSLNNLVDQGTDIYLKDKNAARVVHFLDENRWR